MAQDGPKIDTGDTAWMLTCTALVLMMTIPGLALFYAGMVRKKNVLATMMQSFAIAALVTVVWMVAGYSLAFGDGSAYDRRPVQAVPVRPGENWDKPFTLGSGDAAVATTIPETVFLMFQMTFAIITPALITGAFADRMKFCALVLFSVLWTTADLHPGRALGLAPEWLDLRPRRARLRRRHGGAHQCRRRRPGLRRSCSASGSATARQPCRPTTWRSR